MFTNIYLILVVCEVGFITGFLLSPNTTEAPCVDSNAACDAFDICNVDFHTAKRLCKKYCNLCDVVDGGWSFWGSWDTCSTTCGNGTRTRTRACDNPLPANRGDDCPGPQQETSTCLMNPCPVHGGWGVWGTWGTCSSSCGIGLRRRDRACDSPWNPCIGESLAYEICFDYQCDIGWTSWSGWSGCSSTCGQGSQSRTRTCQNPAVSALNNSCPGESKDYRECTYISCAVGWTAWSGWGGCSSTCGQGSQSRTRTCQNPAVSALNNSCAGDNTDYRVCSDVSCAIGWTSWSGWSGCSSTCGPGLQSRTRTCQNPAVSALNNSCPGDSTNDRVCTDSSCSSLFTATRLSIIDTYMLPNVRFTTILNNLGNDYDSSSGVFTCRIAGQYWFSASITKSNTDNVGQTWCYIMINGSEKVWLYHYEQNPLHAYLSMTASGGFHLTQGDRVQVGNCANPDFLAGGSYDYFSGVLIKPDV